MCLPQGVRLWCGIHQTLSRAACEHPSTLEDACLLKSEAVRSLRVSVTLRAVIGMRAHLKASVQARGSLGSAPANQRFSGGAVLVLIAD